MSCVVYKRPGLDSFLRQCCAEFQTFVFTAGTQAYADPLLDHLDPARTLLSGRFYRSDCRPVQMGEAGAVQYLKDITTLPEIDLQRSVLVDNNPISFVCQPSNGIPVPDFIGQHDDVLSKVLSLLRKLEPLQDVRPTLD